MTESAESAAAARPGLAGGRAAATGRPRIALPASPDLDREAVAVLLGGETVALRRGRRCDGDLVVAPPHGPAARFAAAVATRRRLPLVTVSEGYFRGARVGGVGRSVGWTVDRLGHWERADAPSAFEVAVARRAAAPDDGAGGEALRLLRRARPTRDDDAPLRSAAELGLPLDRDLVLVVDQPRDDPTIAAAGADAGRFATMLDAALAENPGRTIAVLAARGGPGHLAGAARRHGLPLVEAPTDSWSFWERTSRLHTVAGHIGLEALLAGVPVSAHAAAGYAGWGLTDDRAGPIARRTARPTLEAFAAALLLDHGRWLDPWTCREIGFADALDRLVFLRDRHLARPRSVCLGFTPWKRAGVARFLTGVGGAPVWAADDAEAVAVARRDDARLVIWGSRPLDPALPAPPEPPIRAEDGFLRSVGLGAAFIAPASLVFDPEGIYYDPSRPSRFETLARTIDLDAALIERAARLRRTIVERRLSKYNEAPERRLDLPRDRPRILVPGQVEDDASVRLGSPEVRTNLELLRRARARWPDAHLVYKPHPDVAAGYRIGMVSPRDAAALADRVVTDVSMAALLDEVDRVETMTSLTGFEALIRGLAVTTHGIPFYAGWGLTEDLIPCPRRDRRLSIDELVAVALLLYPDYVDPVSGRPCPAEVVVDRLSEGRVAPTGRADRLRAALRHAYAWSIHNTLLPIVRRLSPPRR